MKNLFTFIVVSLFIAGDAIAQQTSRIPLNVLMLAEKLPPGSSIGLLVEGDPTLVASAAKIHGGRLRQATGQICSIEIPVEELTAFCKESVIKSIGQAPINLQPLNDTMRAQSHVDEVHNGLSPLTQSYKGRNVVMGILDSGIDFNHPDFKDSLGNTRIAFLWDQRDASGTGPAPYNYGTLWTAAQIDAGQCTHNDLAYYGHGTHVSGLAAGNGRSTTVRNYSGVAPEAKMIVVAIDFNGSNSTSSVADATAWIYAQAQAMGLPCVINASLGDYYGSHDGQDLQTRLMDTLIMSQNGRSFVSAAGNAGDLDIHLSYALSSDTAFTWFDSNNGGDIYIQLWADTNNFNMAKMAIGCVNNTSWTDRGRTQFTSMLSNVNLFSIDTLRNGNGQRLGIIRRQGSIQGSAYSMEFLITPDSVAGYNWSLETTGNGEFDCWSFDFVPNTAIPSSSIYPRIVHYRPSDREQTMVGGFQCSPRVLVVANYVNRSKWPSVDTVWQFDATVTAGDIMSNSSQGPTRDGRLKPEIAAPGANTFSCGVISELPFFIANAPQVVALGGYHIQGGGTSAASPVVAGTAALCLERNPAASWQQIYDAIIYCARTDIYTGPTNTQPNVIWGYGKVDAFSTITNCFLTTTGPEFLQNESELFLYPNPVMAGESFTVQLKTSANSVRIINLMGETVRIFVVPQQQNSLTLTTANLAPGVYLLQLDNGSTTRMVIQ